MSGDWLDGVPERFRPSIAANVPANIALMRLLGEAIAPEEAQAVLTRALADAPAVARDRIAALLALSARLPDAWSIVRGVLAEAEHGASSPARDTVEHWAAVFDRLARAHPEAAVALYALGSSAMLAATTGEIVAALREWGLVGPTRHVLEIGCGIGRFVRALAPLSASVLGLDVSGEMINEARRRCADVGNVRLAQSSGRDLGAVADESVDLVLAADVFPYLVLADVAERHVAEAARVLRSGGTLAILNYSYRGDPALDRREVASHFAGAGLVPRRTGRAEFAHWDGVTFLGTRP